MSTQIADRLLWAVEILAVAPDDHILEVGCGHGIAVSLICDKLIDGKITAIDRSQTMIAAAMKRNREHVDSGKAVLQTTTLDKAAFGDARFNKIFAINVSAFWTPPAREWDILRPSLLPNGKVYIVHQPPVAAKVQESVDQLTKILRAHHFNVDKMLYSDLKPVQAVCMIAQPIY